MNTPLDPAFGPLLAHANMNLLSLGLEPLDPLTFGATAPVAPASMDVDRGDPYVDCQRCGGRGYIITLGVSVTCPDCTPEAA